MSARKKIRIKFTDSWEAQEPRKSLVYKILQDHYDVELSEDPEYCFAGAATSQDWMNYDCIRIQCIGENVSADFNNFDYAWGFDYLSFGDRYIRMLLYVFYPAYMRLTSANQCAMDSDALLNRRFCSFVVSNNGGDSLRELFFHRLSQYKRVDSGGKFLNNIGQPNGVANKLAFIKDYKFNIAFENSAVPGYTTEKIMEPLSARVVPIYWGNPLIERDFSSRCFVHLRGESDIDQCIEEIIHLDSDDAAYLKMCEADKAPESYNVYGEAYLKQLTDFLCHIVNQPYGQARRLSPLGFQRALRSRQLRTYKTIRYLQKIKHLIRNPFK